MRRMTDARAVAAAVMVPGAAGVPERGAGERVAGVGGPCRLGGAGEARPRRVPAPRARLGRGQGRLEPSELRFGDRVVLPAQAHRPGQEPHGLVVREPAGGLRRGAHGVVAGALHLLPPRLGEMPCEVVQPGIEPVAVALLDRLADAPVQQRAPGRGQLRLQRRAQQRVSKYVIPSRSSSASSARHERRTRTDRSRWTRVPSSRWSSRRAALPIALTMRPPAPITIPFWDSVSTHSSALTRIRSPRCSISSTWTSTLCGTSWRVRASTCSRTSSARSTDSG